MEHLHRSSLRGSFESLVSEVSIMLNFIYQLVMLACRGFWRHFRALTITGPRQVSVCRTECLNRLDTVLGALRIGSLQTFSKGCSLRLNMKHWEGRALLRTASH
jgi:hypothetical protein